MMNRWQGVVASGMMLLGVSALAQTAVRPVTLDEQALKTIGAGVTAPEGPTPLPDGRVAMVEFSLGNIVTVKDGKRAVLAHLGSGVAGTALGKDGALYVAKLNTSAFMRRINADQSGMDAAPAPADAMASPAEGMGGMTALDGTPGGIFRIDLRTKAVTTLYSALDNTPLDAPNDLVVDGWGDLWLSEPSNSSVLNARTDGSQVRRVLEGVKGVNGIALSPDKRTLYVMNEGRLVSFQIAGRGQLKHENGKPVATTVAVWPEKLHEPDGLKTDANGDILCAAWDDGIVRFSPDGRLLSQTIVPGQQVINLAFSPGDKNALYLAVHPANSMTGSLIRIPWDTGNR